MVGQVTGIVPSTAFMFKSALYPAVIQVKVRAPPRGGGEGETSGLDASERLESKDRRASKKLSALLGDKVRSDEGGHRDVGEGDEPALPTRVPAEASTGGGRGQAGRG